MMLGVVINVRVDLMNSFLFVKNIFQRQSCISKFWRAFTKLFAI